MDIETTSPSASMLDAEAQAAQTANSDAARSENSRQVAALSEVANEAQIAEHIRGMVAATMGHLSAEASETARKSAANWQQWALGVADGVKRSLPAAV